MTIKTCAARLLPITLIPLSGLAAMALVTSAQAATPASKSAGIKASASQIIDLPLNPVVGAGQRSCGSKTASGLGYSVLKAAAAGQPAARPGQTDVVLINYIGYLSATGAVFDQAMATPMPVGEVISGFSEGLRLMPKGSIYRICIPAALGYGAEAQGPIPANSDLAFQIELLDFKSAAEIEAMRKAHGPDGAAAGSAGETPPAGK